MPPCTEQGPLRHLVQALPLQIMISATYDPKNAPCQFFVENSAFYSVHRGQLMRPSSPRVSDAFLAGPVSRTPQLA